MHINHDQFANMMEPTLRSLLETSGAKDAPRHALKAVLILAQRFAPEDTPEEAAIWSLRDCLAETDDDKRLAILNEMISGLEVYRDAMEAACERELDLATQDHAAYVRQNGLTARDVL